MELHDREPPRVRLANLPTRSHWLRFKAGARIWVKRDDQTGSELSGNKVRKLEYLMAEAVAENATHIITCGGEQSNHARATAFAAKHLDMASVLVLRTEDPGRPPAPTGNILLDRLVGADIRWITRTAWRDRNRLMAAEADRVRAAGGRPYVIPEGGSNALGSWGYIRAMHELAADLHGIAAPDHPVTVIYACGSGGTGAGLIMGAKLLGLAGRRRECLRRPRVLRRSDRPDLRRRRGALAARHPRHARRHRHHRRPRRRRLREEPTRGARHDP